MKIITGALGFVGSNLFHQLKNSEQGKIILIDSSVSHEKIKNKNMEDQIILDSELDQKEIKKLCKHKFESIFHIGANTDVNCDDQDLMITKNYKSSVEWFKFANNAKCDLIYASTSAVYGNSKKFSITPENENPENEYSRSKLMFDNYVRENISNFKKILYGFRFFNVFGKGEEHKKLNSSMPKRFFDMLMNDQKVELFDENISRDYVCVKALCRVLINYKKLNLHNGIYNLGSGNPISHKRVLEIVISVINKELLTKYDERNIVKIQLPDRLKNRFQFYTKAEDLNSSIAFETSNNISSIEKYIQDLCFLRK